MSSEGSGCQLGVIGSLALSVTSSVAIVICNKALMSSLASLATTLTSWHLMVTFCTLHVAQRLRFFEPKSIDGKTVILFGVLNGTSIGLLNLSLGFNSIGFHQMTKLAIIPFTVMLETIFLKKKFSQSTKLSLPHFAFWCWHCFYNGSQAQSCWLHSLSPGNCYYMCWTNYDKHNTGD